MRYLISAAVFMLACCTGTTAQPCRGPIFHTQVYGPGASDIELADVDGDGDLDKVVTGDRRTAAVAIWLNRGDGVFGFDGEYGTFDHAADAACSDIDRDGDVDIVVAHPFEKVIRVLINDGEGRFANGGEIMFYFQVLRVELADLNGDGLPDVLAWRDGLTVVHNLGGGTFEPPPYESVGIDLADLGDVDGDGDIDLLGRSTRPPRHDVALFRNDGSGQFEDVPLADTPRSLAAAAFADITGDGRQDVVYWPEYQMASVVLQRADGTFDPPIPDAGPLGTSWTTVTDLDLDGLDDVVLAHGDVRLVRSLGGGLLDEPVSIDAGQTAYSVAVGDLNGDGYPDLAAASAAAVVLSDGAGGYGQRLASPSGELLERMTTADFNGDGIPDVAGIREYLGECWVLLGLGDGRFGEPRLVAENHEPIDVLAHDVNEDGASDLLITNTRWQVGLLLNDGAGNFGAEMHHESGERVGRMALGDLDGDAREDLVVVNHESNSLGMFFLDGGESLGTVFEIAVPLRPIDVEIVDLDGDGDNDLLVGHQILSSPTVLLNDGPRTYRQLPPIDVQYDMLFVDSADFDRDGDADVLVTHDGAFRLLYNRGDATFSVGDLFSWGSRIEEVHVEDIDTDGYPDIAYINDDYPCVLWNTAGSFTSESCFDSAGSYPDGLTVADANLDGRPDLLVGETWDNVVTTLLNQCSRACAADMDGDGELTLLDFLAFRDLFDAGEPAADLDHDGELTLVDFLAFQNHFAAGC
ncbi:MAG: FG-GAP-like repeat-containing protein [Planctomycetota bacterium]